MNKTSGEILKQARLKLKLTFVQISRQTKIPIHTLKALEKNQFNKLPSAPYIKGFIKNYSQTVNLNPQKILAVFRRDFAKTKNIKIIPKGLAKPLNQPKVKFNSRLTIFSAIIIFFIIFFSYLGFSLFKLFQPPKLNISSPIEGQEVTSPTLIKGKTDNDAVLTLNGKTLNLESDGSFTTIHHGVSGPATLRFKAVSRKNKAIETELHFIITQ